MRPRPGTRAPAKTLCMALLIACPALLSHAQQLEDTRAPNLSNESMAQALALTSTAEVTALPPESFGIDDIEDVIEGMLSKKKVSGAIVGTTISAALSAHPLGAFLGGLIGAFVGKESKYQQTQQAASSLTQDDLFARLDKMEAELDASPTTPTSQAGSLTVSPLVVSAEPVPASISTVPTLAVRAEPLPLPLPSNGCYQHKDNQTRDRLRLRRCFYHMY